MQADEPDEADKPILWLYEQATRSLCPTGFIRAESLQTLSGVYSAALNADYVDPRRLRRHYCREIFDNMG